MGVTMKDIAALANVSVATVSHVCSGKRHVSAELVQRVEEAIAKLRYVPNRAAQLLRGIRSGIVGVIIPHYTMHFYGEMLAGMQAVAMKNGFTISTFETKHILSMDAQALPKLPTLPVDGIIIVSQSGIGQKAEDGSVHPEVSQILQSPRYTPIVTIETASEIEGIDSVVVDEVYAGYLATEHLISLGARRIAYLGGPEEYANTSVRKQGYHEALEHAKLYADPALYVCGEFTVDSGAEMMQKLLARRRLPDGIFAANDAIAVGAMGAAKHAGIRVPDDLIIVGHDDCYLNAHFTPSLSSVRVPSYEMGAVAVKKILQRIREHDLGLPRSVDEVVKFPVSMCVRDSTRRMPGALAAAASPEAHNAQRIRGTCSHI